MTLILFFFSFITTKFKRSSIFYLSNIVLHDPLSSLVSSIHSSWLAMILSYKLIYACMVYTVQNHIIYKCLSSFWLGALSYFFRSSLVMVTKMRNVLFLALVTCLVTQNCFLTANVSGFPSQLFANFLAVDEAQINGTRWAVLVAGSNGWGNYRHQVYTY